MSIPQGQNPYPGYSPQGGPPQPGDASRPMYPSSVGSPYPAAAGPSTYSGGGMNRRVSSRTLPIIVGVGVAVGVFGGLMIIRGTGSSSAAANDPEVLVGENEGGDKGEDSQGGEPPVQRTPDAGVAAVVAAATVDAAVAQVTPPEPQKRTVTLRFDVTPKSAGIQVDGEEVEKGAFTLELAPDERKQVEVVVEAEGYEPWTKKVAVSTKGTEQVVSATLQKVAKVEKVDKVDKDDKQNNRRNTRTRDNNNNNNNRRRDRDNRRSGGIIDL